MRKPASEKSRALASAAWCRGSRLRARFSAMSRGCTPTVSSWNRATTLRQPLVFGFVLLMPHLLEPRAELLGIRQLDHARELVVGHALAAEGHHAALEGVEGLGLFQFEASGDDLSHHRMLFSDDGHVLDV